MLLIVNFPFLLTWNKTETAHIGESLVLLSRFERVGERSFAAVAELLLPGGIIESRKQRHDGLGATRFLAHLLLVCLGEQTLALLDGISATKELSSSSLLSGGVVVARADQIQEFFANHDVVLVLVSLLHQPATTSMIDVHPEEALVTSVDDLHAK